MADPTNASLHLKIPSEADLLIRSLTTALSIFSPDSGAKNRHHQSGRYDQFDRMSLFFVSKASEDAAAITALVEDNYITFQIVHSQRDVGRLSVMKNPDHRDTMTPDEGSEAPVDVPLEYLQDPVRCCLQWGPRSISPKTHSAILQHLLRSMYQPERTAEKNSAADILHRYIYSFCVDKIFRRLNAKIPGFKSRYLSLFLPSTDGITLDGYREYSERKVVLPKRLASKDDSKLLRVLSMRYPNRNFKICNKQLTLDIEDQWAVWTCFQHFLEQARESLDNIRALKSRRGKIGEDGIKSALNHLDDLKKAMAIIFVLARYSPSFWIVMERMAPLLERRLGSETRDGHYIPSTGLAVHPGPSRDATEHPPSSTEPAPPADHTLSPRFFAQVDENSSEESDGDDATSDAETISRSRSNKATEQPEDLHDVISKNWCKLTVMARHWMKSITQWHHGFEDLAQGPRKLGILSNRLTIDVSVAPVSSSPTQQASLVRTIESMVSKPDLSATMSILREAAASLCLNGANEDLLQTLANQDLTDEAIEERWVSGFRGAIHCEAQLAANILQKSPSGQRRLIGVSELCCFCCAELLKTLNVNNGDIVEHGKIYSWSPPCEATEEAKKVVLGKLQDKFQTYLASQERRRHRIPDLGSSNDSNDGHELNVFERVMSSKSSK